MVSCLYLCHRPEPVGFVPGDQASAAFPAVADAAAVRAAAAVVVRGAPVVNELADPAHVASAVVVAAGLQAVLVGSARAPVHDAFVVVAAAAEQLRGVVVAVAVALVRRRVRPAVAVVAQVALHVQLAVRLRCVPRDAARSADVVAPARCVAGRVARRRGHVATAPVALVEQPAATMFGKTFAPFVVHRVPAARLSP